VKNKFSQWLWFNFPNLALGLSFSIKNRNMFCEYKKLIGSLCNIQDLNIVHLSELMSPNLIGQKVISIRHDVDSDIFTALKMSAIESRAGIGASYYFLPSAPYYRFQKNGVFKRSMLLIKYLKIIKDNGGEIGLHIDCLNDSLKYDLPPEKSLADELRWIRAAGLVVNGCASHASYHLYGAANYEIFNGYQIESRKGFVDLKGRECKLGTIQMEDYGLRYEANYILESYLSEVPSHKYAVGLDGVWEVLVRNYDYQYSILDYDEWCVTDNKRMKENGKLELRTVRTDQMLNELRQLSNPFKAVIDIHPIYYGKTIGRKILNYVRGL